MAPKESKGKSEVEEIPDLAKGWKIFKMFEAKNWRMLQSRAIIQRRSAEGDDRPYEGTLETDVDIS